MLNNDFELLKEVIGEKILSVQYVENEYHSNLSGDWTNTNPDNFLLTMRQIEVQFENGRNIFFRNHNQSMKISDKDEFPKFEKLHFPSTFDWSKVKNKPIKNYKIWECQAKYSNKRILFKNKTYFKQIGIVMLSFQEVYKSNIYITLMDGDLGSSFFYPNGILKNIIGVFFNKTIASEVKIYDFIFLSKTLK